MNKQEEFQKIIGYRFQNEKLLKQALTHSSYANEKHMKDMDNERLELGDAVLELITSEFLFQNYPKLSEGDLTKMRASLVCEPTLAACTLQIRLGEFVYLGKGEELTGGRERKSILSDALEAVIWMVVLLMQKSLCSDLFLPILSTNSSFLIARLSCRSSFREIARKC